MSKPALKLSPISCDTPTQSSHPPATNHDDRRERELDRISGTAEARTMSVAFGAFVNFLSHAIRDDAAWLDDFADDTVQIDADLHDVLMTYQQLRQRKAA
jgi:hypothetical protein